MALYLQKLTTGIGGRNSNYDSIYFTKTNNVLAVIVTSNNSAGLLLAGVRTFTSTVGIYSVVRDPDGFITALQYAGSPIKTYTYSSPGVISTITEVINSVSYIAYITKTCTYDANGLLSNINVV